MAPLTQLRAGHRRKTIAAGLDNLVRDAHEHPLTLSAQVPFQRQDVFDARDELALLAQALRTSPNPSPAGVSAANELLTSSDSPVFQPCGAQAIRDAARVARDALSRRGTVDTPT
jgi:hypothetical protein